MTRHDLFEILEEGELAGRTGALVQRTLATVTLVSIVFLVAAPLANLPPPWHVVFVVVEAIALGVFAVEYAARLWVAPEDPRFRHVSSPSARLASALQVSALVDLIVIALITARPLLPDHDAAIAALGLVRCVKLVRYSAMLRALVDTLVQTRQALLACLVIVIGTALISGALIFVFEHGRQPQEFANLGSSIWWAIDSLSGAGTSETVPVTAPGLALYAFLSLFGFLVIALPMGVIASAFDATLTKREFIVTWSMLAKVPLFRTLDAGDIGEIAGRLRSERFQRGEAIVRRGEPGDRMFFLLDGEVEIEESGVRLGRGEYFGEIALVSRDPRNATVRSCGRTRLLSLARSDVAALMDRRPAFAAALRETTELRRKRPAAAQSGPA